MKPKKRNEIDKQIENKRQNHAVPKEREQAILSSEFCTNNAVGSAIVMDGLFDKTLDVKTLADHLSETDNKVVAGDLHCVESLLVSQAKILDAVFKSMLLRMTNSEFNSQMQVYSSIALKAQSQARQTLSVLSELKNPKRTMFIKQQNNALNQQVNPVNSCSNSQKTENNSSQSNELLIEAKTHETLDFGRTSEASTVNSQLETMGQINGCQNT